MNLDIQFRNVRTSPALTELTERKLHAALSRFGTLVQAVEVRIGDLSGPKGGKDKYCRMTLNGPLGTITVRKGAEDAYAAVHLAAERLARAMGRKLERSRSRDRRAPRTVPVAA